MRLMEDHVDLIAAAEAGRPAARFNTGPYLFLRMHVGMLVREADPLADWELLTDVVLAPLSADSFVYWCRQRGMESDRILVVFDALIDRLLPA